MTEGHKTADPRVCVGAKTPHGWSRPAYLKDGDDGNPDIAYANHDYPPRRGEPGDKLRRHGLREEAVREGHSPSDELLRLKGSSRDGDDLYLIYSLGARQTTK